MSSSPNREEVVEMIREYLAKEFELEPGGISEASRFKEDFDADSLDLHVLGIELEDKYGISISEKEGGQIVTVGDAVDFVMAKAGS